MLRRRERVGPDLEVAALEKGELDEVPRGPEVFGPETSIPHGLLVP
jgi:hypothetical protein